MRSFAITTFVLATFTGLATAQDICSEPERDNCSFYATCLEPTYQCGESGYPIGYGQKYCTAFSDQRDKLTPEPGQVWMLDTMQCLQRFLVPEATHAEGAAQTCEELNDKAFGSHAECYIDNGLCTLPVEDWFAIVDIVELKTLFQSWEAFLATVEAADGCLDFYAWLLVNLV